MNDGGPLKAELKRQFAGTHLSDQEQELARLCWLGGAHCFARLMGKAKREGKSEEMAKTIGKEMSEFLAEVDLPIRN